MSSRGAGGNPRLSTTGASAGTPSGFSIVWTFDSGPGRKATIAARQDGHDPVAGDDPPAPRGQPAIREEERDQHQRQADRDDERPAGDPGNGNRQGKRHAEVLRAVSGVVAPAEPDRDERPRGPQDPAHGVPRDTDRDQAADVAEGGDPQGEGGEEDRVRVTRRQPSEEHQRDDVDRRHEPDGRRSDAPQRGAIPHAGIIPQPASRVRYGRSPRFSEAVPSARTRPRRGSPLRAPRRRPPAPSRRRPRASTGR